MLNHGHTVRAVYKLAKSHPSHPNVVLAIKRGLPDSEIVQEDAPSDIINWLIKWDNNFHGGVDYAIMEYMRDHAIAAAELQVYPNIFNMLIV